MLLIIKEKPVVVFFRRRGCLRMHNCAEKFDTKNINVCKLNL